MGAWKACLCCLLTVPVGLHALQAANAMAQTASPGRAVPAEAVPSGAERDGLRLEIQIPKRVYRKGESMPVTCALRNLRRDPVLVEIPDLPGLSVIHPNGETLRGAITRCGKTWFPGAPVDGCLKTIPPGKVLDYKIDLAEEFGHEARGDEQFRGPTSFAVPGTYTVRCEYGNESAYGGHGAWTGFLRSAPIEIEIAVPGPEGSGQ
jgi:hypothetical protein